jgi:hypothetical protein
MSSRYDIRNNGETKTYVYFKPTENNHLEDIKMLLGSLDTIEVYDGSSASDPYNSYKNITDYIYRITTNSEFLCKGLNPDYILDSFNEVDAVVIVGSTTNLLPNGNIFGFASIKFEEMTNSIYVDVICSHIGIKGAGELLLNEIEEISRNLFITKVRLNSVKGAIPFYEKYGFIKTEKYGSLWSMIKLNSGFGGKRRKMKRVRRTRRSKKSTKSRKSRKTLKRT